MLGRRQAFALVLAVTVLAPAPAVSTFRIDQCFFDRGSAAITERCLVILSHFVGDWTRQTRDGGARFTSRFYPTPPTPYILILAHMDGEEARSGFTGLDETRAYAVEAQLVQLGIVPDALIVQAFAATRLPVPTRASEPQNRVVGFVVRWRDDPALTRDWPPPLTGP